MVFRRPGSRLGNTLQTRDTNDRRYGGSGPSGAMVQATELDEALEGWTSDECRHNHTARSLGGAKLDFLARVPVPFGAICSNAR